jgi:PAS domain S-box-containing protein
VNFDTHLLELLPAAVYMTDAAGRITFYNEAAADLWGCRPELGTSRWCGSWRLYWPDGRPMAHDQCPMAVALREGRPVRGEEAIAERPDGTRVPFRPYPTPIKDTSGRIVGAINLLVDISDLEGAAFQSERLAAIVASSDDAIISKTLDGRITSWNAGATRIFGYEADEMIGQPIIRIIPPELHEEEKEILAKLRRGEHVDHYETIRIAKDGRRIDISLTVSPLRDKSGKVIGASKVSRDITDRKQAEKLQNLLVEELNHRVKNTLATIQAIASQSLRRAKSSADFVSAFSGRIHALAKAHALLTQANLQGAQVMDLVREQVLLGVSDNRITCSGPMLMLDAQDAMQLALVLHELATNARKYGALSMAEGRLSVCWEIRANGGKELLLDWKETGGPIVKVPSRRGFGTTLIEQTLRSRGGKASISYADTGISCTISLPLPDKEHIGMRAAAAVSQGLHSASLENMKGRPALDGKHILIVEDEPLVSMDVAAILSDEGCEIVGPAGTIEIAKTLLTNTRCDAALVDVNLAGKTVDELAAALAKTNIPFAFVTGYGREALPAGYREAIVVTKPFSSEVLIETVQRLVAHASPSAGIVRLVSKK